MKSICGIKNILNLKEYNFKRNTEYHDVKGTIYINSDKDILNLKKHIHVKI